MIADEGFQPLAVTVEHAQRAGSLPGPLQDPFDRMLIAQAMLDNLHLVSIERAFDAYGVACACGELDLARPDDQARAGAGIPRAKAGRRPE